MKFVSIVCFGTMILFGMQTAMGGNSTIKDLLIKNQLIKNQVTTHPLDKNSTGKHLLGEQCFRNKDCNSGLCGKGYVCVCTEDENCGASKFCSKNVCTDLLPFGASCEKRSNCISKICYNKKCTDGVDGSPCFANAYCTSNFCNAHVCSAKAALGASCPDSNGCISGKCYNKLCSDGADGSSCDTYANCTSKYCKDHVCTVKAPNGAPCSVTARALRDLSGCASGKCYNKLCSDGAIGSSCDNHDNCVSKFCKANVCSEKAPKGAPCVDRFGCITNDCAMNICSDGTDGSTCRWGSHCKSRSCMNNICTPKAAVGGVCIYPLDCISGMCYNGKCSDRAIGSSCFSNANCVSKSCVNNVCVEKIAIPLCGPCTKKSECISGFCDWTLNICTYGLKVQPECQK